MTKTKNTAFQLKPLAASLLALGFSSAVLAAPQDGIVRAGSASISQSGNLTQIQQNSDRAVIDWRSFGVGALESVAFNQPSRQSAILNRVTGNQVSAILGKITANGQVALINPNGIVFGPGSQINVGGLIASTANISNKNFMEGRLVFDQPGKPGASILNQGSISAADGGLVALVAPSVRNDGIIQARLGKIALGAGDTFTLDLYGDQLISLALSPEQAAQIVHTGQIHADGGQVVLVTAPTAKAVLDQVINMSGTIRADSIAEQNGKIVLLGAGGEVAVSGQLSAHGGSIEVLGDQVTLTSTAILDASGAVGGGTIHVGGAWQGSGDTYRAQNTDIASGARLSANATDTGNGGEVVIWSDQNTRFAGAIEARGGANGGNGGRIEVSGKGTLEFLGTADASAAKGVAGSLLLDPTDVNIGLAAASLINRVLRTGTSTTVQASNNIDVNSLIDGRGRIAGGGLTLTAGNNLNINEFIVTNNGAVNLNAGGTISVAADKAVFAGTAPITATSGGDLSTVPLISTGTVSYRSTGGSVTVNRAIDSANRIIAIRAAQNVAVNQPIVSLLTGAPLSITADGGDISVNAQIDGRGGGAGGSATLTAGGNVFLNNSIITNNGAINISATGGTLTPASSSMALFSGNGAISVTTGGNLSSGVYVTTGALNLTSTGGNVNVNTKINEAIGNTTIQAAGAVNVNQSIANIRNGSNLAITAGSNIVVNAQIDALDDAGTLATPVAGGAVNLTASNNVTLNESIATFNGAVNVTATNGTLSFLPGTAMNNYNDTKRILAGSAPINITTGGNFTTGAAPPAGLMFAALPGSPTSTVVNAYITDSLKSWVTLVTTGKLTLTSTGGNVSIDAPIPNTTGEIEINAGNAVVFNHKLITDNNPVTINAGAGGVTVNANINNDQYYPGGNGTSSAIDTKAANLIIRSIGDINILDSIASSRTIILDTDGALLRGTIGNSNGAGVRPDNILISADQGIGTASTFFASNADNIEAYSLNGPINLYAFSPARLRIGTGYNVTDFNATGVNAAGFNQTGCLYASNCTLDPNTFPSQGGAVNLSGGSYGPDVIVVAGGNINIPTLVAGNVTLTSSQAIPFNQVVVTNLTARAIGNITFDFTNTGMANPGSVYLSGALTATSTMGNILFNGDSAVHLGTGANLMLTANTGSVAVRRTELDGAVFVNAGQDITFYNPIGADIRDSGNATVAQYANGVSGVDLNAGGNINIQGARSSGLIDIDAVGTFTSNGNSVFSTAMLATPVTIDSSNVTFAGTAYLGTTIATQLLLDGPFGVAPAIPPGPQVAPPSAPAAISAPPSSAPGGISVAGISAPATGGDITDSASSTSSTTSSTSRFEEIIPDTDAIANAEVRTALNINESNAAGSNPLLVESPAGQIVVFSGGRGVAQLADLGRGNVFSAPPNVFAASGDNDCSGSYFKSGAFGCGK